MRLTVADDGCGFDVGAIEGGRGVRGMRARAREIGGELKIESRPGEGTRVTLTLPRATAQNIA